MGPDPVPELHSDSWVIGRVPCWMHYLGLWSPWRQVPSCWSHIYVATCPAYPLVRRQVPNEGIKKLSTYLPTGLRFLISGVISSRAIAPRCCKTDRLYPLIESTNWCYIKTKYWHEQHLHKWTAGDIWSQEMKEDLRSPAQMELHQEANTDHLLACDMWFPTTEIHKNVWQLSWEVHGELDEDMWKTC